MRNLFVLAALVMCCCGCGKRSSDLGMVAGHLELLVNGAPKSVVDIDEMKDDDSAVMRVIGRDFSEENLRTDLFLGAASSSCVVGDFLYICDRLNDCITIADSNGTLLKRIGRHGKAPGEFISPVNIAARNEAIFVYEFGNTRIQIFDARFKYLSSIPAAYNFLTGSLSASRDMIYVHGSFSDTVLLKAYETTPPFAFKYSLMPLLTPRTGKSLAFNAVKFSANEEGYLCVGYTALPYLFIFDPQRNQKATIEFTGKSVEGLLEAPKGLTTSGMPVRIFIGGLSLLPDGRVIFSEGKRVLLLENRKGNYVLTRTFKPNIGREYIRHISVDSQKGYMYLSTDLTSVYQVRFN